MIWVKTIISGLYEGITSSALKLFPSAVRRCQDSSSPFLSELFT